MNMRQKEELLRKHQKNEHWSEMYEGTWQDDPSHLDGCFYCGSYNHPSDCCTDDQAITEYWEEM